LQIVTIGMTMVVLNVSNAAGISKIFRGEISEDS
jgi:hypothetical protein